ncbi:unnamed protein product, partial [Sphenostylis stenocarpa]
ANCRIDVDHFSKCYLLYNENFIIVRLYFCKLSDRGYSETQIRSVLAEGSYE